MRIRERLQEQHELSARAGRWWLAVPLASIIGPAYAIACPGEPTAALVAIAEQLMDQERQNLSVSYVNGQDWKAGQSTLDAVALVRGGAVTLVGPDGAQQVSALFADAANDTTAG